MPSSLKQQRFTEIEPNHKGLDSVNESSLSKGNSWYDRWVGWATMTIYEQVPCHPYSAAVNIVTESIHLTTYDKRELSLRNNILAKVAWYKYIVYNKCINFVGHMESIQRKIVPLC